jgi:outer membrane protein
VNYTRISNVELGGLQLEKDSWGFSYGLGADIKIASNLYLNFDVKKVQIGSDVLSNGSKISHVNIDPWLFGVGLGMKF